MSEDVKAAPEAKEVAPEEAEKDDEEVVEDAKDAPVLEGEEQPEGELAPDQKEGELKEEDSLKDEGETEYRRKSFHSKPYASPTIEIVQKEVEEMIVKKTR